MAAFFNNTTQGAMDGNIKDTPPIVMVPPDEQRSEWDELKVPTGRRRAAGRRPPRFGPRRLRRLAGRRRPPAPSTTKVTDAGLCFHAPLGDNAGNVLTVSVDGQSRPLTIGGEPQWDEGVTARQGLQDRRPTTWSSQRRGRLRKRPALHVQRVGQGAQERPQRRDRLAHGRRQRLSRLGPVARTTAAPPRTSFTSGPTTP